MSRFSTLPALPASPPDPEIPLDAPDALERHCAKYGIRLEGELLDPAAWGVRPVQQHPAGPSSA